MLSLWKNSNKFVVCKCLKMASVGKKTLDLPYVGQVLGILDPAAFNRISFMLIASKEKSFEKACEENNFND